VRLWVPIVKSFHVLRGVVAAIELHPRTASFTAPSSTATGRDAPFETFGSGTPAFAQAEHESPRDDPANHDATATGPDAGTPAGDTFERPDAAIRTEWITGGTRRASADSESKHQRDSKPVSG
jgi:hypothetical protein